MAKVVRFVLVSARCKTGVIFFNRDAQSYRSVALHILKRDELRVAPLARGAFGHLNIDCPVFECRGKLGRARRAPQPIDEHAMTRDVGLVFDTAGLGQLLYLPARQSQSQRVAFDSKLHERT